jgi:hypothetical protein
MLFVGGEYHTPSSAGKEKVWTLYQIALVKCGDASWWERGDMY